MKKSIIICLLAACSFSISHAQEKHSSVSFSNNNGSRKISINDDNGSFQLTYNGESDISFSDDETAIKNFPADGFLRYEKNGKTVLITVDATGKIAYEINGGDKKSELNSDEKAVVAEVVKMMIEYGVGAKDRVVRIYKSGGSNAVLSEVGRMKTDYVKSLYLDYLLQTNSLSSSDMTEIADNIKRIVSSDYEKGKLLSAFSSKYLGNAATAAAFLEAVKSIHSDYEKAKAVKYILNQTLSAEQFNSVLDIANNIGSDYEKAGVLKEVLSGNKLTATQFTQVLNVATRIQSDYEKAGVMKAVLAENKLGAAQFSEVLNASTHIQSDFEKAGVLKQILSNDVLPEEAFNDALSATSSLGSDFEKAGVLKTLAGKDIKNESHWVSLINASEKIGSDYEKGELLRFIATRMPSTENVKAAYRKAAKTISSDFEYGKTIRATDKM